MTLAVDGQAHRQIRGANGHQPKRVAEKPPRIEESKTRLRLLFVLQAVASKHPDLSRFGPSVKIGSKKRRRDHSSRHDPLSE
jgi:hypothetical protein